jgi:hypothetical protein
MVSVPSVGWAFFPLDEALQLLPGHLSPHAHECLVRLGAWLPFGKSAQLLEQLLGVQVSLSTARRYTQAARAAYEALQTTQVKQIEREVLEAPLGAAKALISVDGAMVPLVKGQWAEVKTLGLGEVTTTSKQGEPVVHSQALSYFRA